MGLLAVTELVMVTSYTVDGVVGPEVLSVPQAVYIKPVMAMATTATNALLLTRLHSGTRFGGGETT